MLLPCIVTCVNLLVYFVACVNAVTRFWNIWQSHYIILEENKEREHLINELEKELELLRIEYEAVCQQRKAK